MPAAKSKNQKKTESIMVRVTPGELRTIDRAANELSYDRAQYLRESGLVRARGAMVVIPENAKEALKALAKEIGVWRALSPDCLTDEEVALLFKKP